MHDRSFRYTVKAASSDCFIIYIILLYDPFPSIVSQSSLFLSRPLWIRELINLRFSVAMARRANYRKPNVIFTSSDLLHVCSTPHCTAVYFPLIALLSTSHYLFPYLSLSLPFPSSTVCLALILGGLCKRTPPLGHGGKPRAGKEREDGSICQIGRRRAEGHAVLMDRGKACAGKGDGI